MRQIRNELKPKWGNIGPPPLTHPWFAPDCELLELLWTLAWTLLWEVSHAAFLANVVYSHDRLDHFVPVLLSKLINLSNWCHDPGTSFNCYFKFELFVSLGCYSCSVSREFFLSRSKLEIELKQVHRVLGYTEILCRKVSICWNKNNAFLNV